MRAGIGTGMRNMTEGRSERTSEGEDKRGTVGRQWYEGMTEAQKTCWYAARDPEEAKRIARKLQAKNLYRWLSIQGVVLLLVVVIRSDEVGWGSWVVLWALGLQLVWALFLDHLLIVERRDTDSE